MQANMEALKSIYSHIIDQYVMPVVLIRGWTIEEYEDRYIMAIIHQEILRSAGFMILQNHRDVECDLCAMTLTRK